MAASSPSATGTGALESRCQGGGGASNAQASGTGTPQPPVLASPHTPDFPLGPLLPSGLPTYQAANLFAPLRILPKALCSHAGPRGSQGLRLMLIGDSQCN